MSYWHFWLRIIGDSKCKKSVFEKTLNSDLENFGLFTFVKRKYVENENRCEAAVFSIGKTKPSAFKRMKRISLTLPS